MLFGGCTSEDAVESPTPAKTSPYTNDNYQVLKQNKDLKKKTKKMMAYIHELESGMMADKTQYERELEDCRRKMEGLVYSANSHHQGICPT